MAPAIDLEHGIAQISGRVDQSNTVRQRIDNMSSATVDCAQPELTAVRWIELAAECQADARARPIGAAIEAQRVGSCLGPRQSPTTA